MSIMIFMAPSRTPSPELERSTRALSWRMSADWFAKNQVRKGNLRGYNSFIAQEPYQEYQIDLFFVNDLKDQDYKIGLIVIDTFSKYMTVVPLKTKQPETCWKL
jgi:hypothetical protein